jgi:ectoine hydroxylase-related dioxygenase (phytanoyl-CoA dioxygenase family)
MTDTVISSALVDPVEPSIESVVEIISDRLGAIRPRAGTVIFDFGSSGRWVADLSNRSLRQGDPPGSSPGAVVAIEPRVMARLLNAEMDPRHALLFGLMRIQGSVAEAVRCCDDLAGRRVPRQLDYAHGVPVPAPTKDNVLARRQLRVHGFAIIADVLSADQLRRLKDRLIDQAAAEREAGVAFFDGGPLARSQKEGSRDQWWLTSEANGPATRRQPNQRVWALHNKGDVFLELLDHPIIDEFIPDFLGDHFLIAEHMANIAGPGGQAMVLHQDQSGVQPPLPVAIGLNILFCLDDFTADNGATRVIPGSHIAEFGLAPDDIYSSDNSVALEAPAGSAILFETRLWHGTGANRSDGLRHGLFLLFERSWIRTQQAGLLCVHPSVLDKMSDRVKTMYAHRVTGAMGKVQGSNEGDFVGWAPDQLVLEMHARQSP